MLHSVGELVGWGLDSPELERKGLVCFQVTSCCLGEGMKWTNKKKQVAIWKNIVALEMCKAGDLWESN